jgi:hypothetical protein
MPLPGFRLCYLLCEEHLRRGNTTTTRINSSCKAQQAPRCAQSACSNLYKTSAVLLKPYVYYTQPVHFCLPCSLSLHINHTLYHTMFHIPHTTAHTRFHTHRHTPMFAHTHTLHHMLQLMTAEQENSKCRKRFTFNTPHPSVQKNQHDMRASPLQRPRALQRVLPPQKEVCSLVYVVVAAV